MGTFCSRSRSEGVFRGSMLTCPRGRFLADRRRCSSSDLWLLSTCLGLLTATAGTFFPLGSNSIFIVIFWKKCLNYKRRRGGAFMYLLPRRNARGLGRLRCQRYTEAATEAAVALTCKPHYIFPWESKRLHERGLPVIYDAAGEQSDRKHQSAIARTRA